MKITQVQTRIIRSILVTKAEAACKLASELASRHAKENDEIAQAVANRILKKYEKRLVKSLVPSLSTYRGYSINRCAVEFDKEVLESFCTEVDEALKEVPFKGTESVTLVAFAALGMTNEFRGRDERQMLRVPANEEAGWRQLADDINAAFMTGDAVKLLAIIQGIGCSK